jgi:hypothetical protein
MASSRILFKAVPVEAGEVVESVRRELLAAGTSKPSADESLALVGRALDMLNAVSHLLGALSPNEVQATAERAHLGRLADEHLGYWKVYSARHRVLTEVFATQRSTYESRAWAYIERRRRPDSGATPLGDDGATFNSRNDAGGTQR